MDTVRVTARREPAGELAFEAYDAQELLRRGNQSLAANSFDQALTFYDRLVGEFPQSRMVSAAHYNAALCHERQNRWQAAAERYEQAAESAPLGRDRQDGLFQAARAYEQLEQWPRVVTLMERLLTEGQLGPDEHVEAQARQGAGLVEEGRYDEGARVLRRALVYYRRLGPDQLRTDYYLAQAQHFLGESERRRMAAIEMTNDEAQFRQALEGRCELLLRAQTQYVQAIRAGNAHWGAASAYRIGAMYSELYDEVMAIPVPDVPVPADITTPEEVAAFREEFPRHYRRLLREYLEPLLHNAIRWWESNIMMVERTGVGGEWVARTRENLRRVSELLASLEADAATEQEPAPAGAAPIPEPGASDAN
jgi:tetratricopeptide (TPR) repeat protein